MFDLAVLLRLLDSLREEAIDAAERPSTDYQTEFGFGRISGMLQALREIRERVEAVVREQEQKESKQEEDC